MRVCVLTCVYTHTHMHMYRMQMKQANRALQGAIPEVIMTGDQSILGSAIVPIGGDW